MVGVQQAEPSVRIQILFFFASCIGKNLFPNQSVCSSAVSTHFLQVLHRPDDGSRLLQGGAQYIGSQIYCWHTEERRPSNL